MASRCAGFHQPPAVLQATAAAPSTSHLSSSLLPRFAPSLRKSLQHRHSSCRTPRHIIRALDLDQDTIVAIGVGLAGVAFGIGVPLFYEIQVKGAESRENDQPCFPCSGSGAQICRFCLGSGNISIELGAGEQEVSKCINCDGAGSITCTTCQGSGVQPRYLDRREFKDDD